MSNSDFAKLKFNNLYLKYGIDLICILPKSKYLTVGAVYRAYKCRRYNYKKNAQIEDGYCVENNKGQFKIYSKRLFNQIS